LGKIEGEECGSNFTEARQANDVSICSSDDRSGSTGTLGERKGGGVIPNSIFAGSRFHLIQAMYGDHLWARFVPEFDLNREYRGMLRAEKIMEGAPTVVGCWILVTLVMRHCFFRKDGLSGPNRTVRQVVLNKRSYSPPLHRPCRHVWISPQSERF
jgi:hypothetical protein